MTPSRFALRLSIFFSTPTQIFSLTNHFPTFQFRSRQSSNNKASPSRSPTSTVSRVASRWWMLHQHSISCICRICSGVGLRNTPDLKKPPSLSGSCLVILAAAIAPRVAVHVGTL